VPQLVDELRAQGASDILVVVGGVVPAQDYDELRAAGASAIFGPGTNIPVAAREVLGLLRSRSRATA
jgi:methylmalonyl-CoA mutase